MSDLELQSLAWKFLILRVFVEPAHCSRSFLEMEIALSQDQISKYADKILLYTNTCMKELRRLFLVQDLVDSLKVCLGIPTSGIYDLPPAECLTRLLSFCSSLLF